MEGSSRAEERGAGGGQTSPWACGRRRRGPLDSVTPSPGGLEEELWTRLHPSLQRASAGHRTRRCYGWRPAGEMKTGGGQLLLFSSLSLCLCLSLILSIGTGALLFSFPRSRFLSRAVARSRACALPPAKTESRARALPPSRRLVRLLAAQASRNAAEARGPPRCTPTPVGAAVGLRPAPSRA